MRTTNIPCTIGEYIAEQPDSIQNVLEEFRGTIKNLVPEAEEKISYQMPTFYLKGNMVDFAVFKNHIGFYPGASGVAVFQEELKNYKTSKGAIQFPINQPIPYDLVTKIVLYRAKENLEKAALKSQKGKTKKATSE